MARKILLADDSVTAQSMGRRILTDAGYEVVTVSNGSAALKKIAECRPDLIVLDVYMPGYGGLEVCQRLKEARETARIPVLLSVGKLEPFKPEEARRVRADAYIVKPFEASELLTALTKLEDKIVPQPETYKPGRFAKAVAAVEPSSAPEPRRSDESYGDAETGWKDRLIIPHPAPKERETEAEAPAAVPHAADTEFRNLARGEDFKPVEVQPEFERPVPAGLPADISAEEIAAIAAAAAAVSGRSEEPAPQEQAPVAEAVVESTATASAEIQTASAAGVTEESQPEAADETVSDAAAATLASAPEAQVEAVPESAPEPAHEAAPTPPPVEFPVAPEPVVSSEGAAANESPAVSEAPAAPVVAELPSPTEPAAADDEVLAALASLAPVNGDETANAVEKTEPDPFTVAAAMAGAGMAAVGRESGGPRWMAEAVPVDEQESTFLLEQEMEKAYAAMAAAEAAHAMVAAHVVETAASALETMAASSTAPPVYTAPAAVSVSEPAASLSEPAPVAEAVSATPVSPEMTTPAVATASETAAIAPEEEVAFAAAASAGSGTAEATPAGPAEGSHTTTPEFAESERQRESELASAWANWKPGHESNTESQAAAQIADAEAGFNTPTEEAATVEPKPEPEAATASTDDAGEISDIVDNMLAELKPKLMAEISKKLKKGKNKK